MKTLLITAIGGDIAQSVARIVRETDQSIRIVGVDVHERHAGRHFADHTEVIPPADAPAYVPTLNDIAQRVQADVVWPIHEAELALLAKRGVEAISTPVVWAGAKAVSVGLDKLRTIQSIAADGHPVPWTMDASDGDPVALPCIAKPRRSSGSRGVELIRQSHDVRRIQACGVPYVFQQYLHPSSAEVTCGLFRNSIGQSATICFERTLSGGLTGWACTIDLPPVAGLVSRIGKLLSVTGTCNVQLRLMPDGTPMVFEVNPRVSSTAVMRQRLGFCDVGWTLREQFGVGPRFCEEQARTTAGREVARVFDAVVLPFKGNGS